MIGITSFSPKGYEIYGKNFLEGAVECWPGEIVAYVDETPDFRHDKISYKLLSENANLKAFLAYCERNPVFCGHISGHYNYNYDARRFSFKAFSQFDALTYRKGKIFWLDGDIKFKKPLEADFLDDLFDGKTICMMQRKNIYTESGFVGFDTKGVAFDHFLETYIDVYRKGRLFNLPGWHDCYALDHAVAESLVPIKNLSEALPVGNLNAIDFSPLSPYMKHNKGNRKFKAA